MTKTFILYLGWLMEFYKGKKIGLVIDYDPSHANSEMKEWVEKLNVDHANSKYLPIASAEVCYKTRRQQNLTKVPYEQLDVHHIYTMSFILSFKNTYHYTVIIIIIPN